MIGLPMKVYVSLSLSLELVFDRGLGTCSLVDEIQSRKSPNLLWPKEIDMVCRH